MQRLKTTVKTNNQFLSDIVVKFDTYLFDQKSAIRNNSQQVIFTFAKSLSRYEDSISDVYDFNANTLFTQLDFYKEMFAGNEHMRTSAIKYIIYFYRWLIKENTNTNLFADSPNMCSKLLLSNSFFTLVSEGYCFYPFDPKNTPKDKSKICFVLKNADRISTLAEKETFIHIDLSELKSAYYRNLIIEHFVIRGTSQSPFSYGVYRTAQVMQALYRAKSENRYPTPNTDILTVQEAAFIRNYINALPNLKISSKNEIILAIGTFLRYCHMNGYIRVEDPSFDYFTKFSINPVGTSKAVSDEDLIALSNYFWENGRDNIFFEEMYVVFHLLVQTEFRISQICHLKIDSIRSSIKPGQYEVASISKTSYGELEHFVITKDTYDLLMGIIERTEPIRERCSTESLRDYIFLYERNSDTFVFNVAVFGNHLRYACDALNIARYNATNLRDTHMTKALEYIIRTGKSDAEMAILTHHKSIDTTSNHYINMKLNEMLETTYGITIGNIYLDADNKVVDNIPNQFEDENSDVENGCGICTAEACNMEGMLPCLTCKNFYTTTKHEPYFRRAIENVDKLIENTENAHDKEDLITMKRLYVTYLKAILTHKELEESADERLTGS